MSFYGYSLICLWSLACASALPMNGSTFDQRQTGEYNIHISLKDIKIVALLNGGLGGSEDYDYNYDYADMTIKPSPGENGNKTNSTTIEPSSTEPSTLIENENASTSTEVVVEITPHSPTTAKPSSSNSNDTVIKDEIVIKNETSSNKNKTEIKPNLNKPHDHNIPVQIVLTPVEILSEPAKLVTTTSVPTPSTANNKIKQANCIEGFVKDRQGNCRPRARKPPQQSLLRKLIQLSQRTQLPKATS